MNTIWTNSETNLSFRKLSSEDLSLLLELKNESWFGTHKISILNIEDQIHWYQSLDKNPHTPNNLFLIAEDNNLKIGVFKFNNIDWYNRRADVGWDIFKKYRGKGYGINLVSSGVKFANQLLQLHRLTAEILITNLPSIKCAEKAGFILEGTKKQEIFRDKKYIDNLIYGIIL